MAASTTTGETMHVNISPSKAPLAKYDSLTLKQIKMDELTRSLAQRGVEIIGGGGTVIELNLRGLVEASGTVRNAQRTLMQTLQELGADAVSLTPADIDYMGMRDAFSFGVMRGLESGVPAIVEQLTDIPISEDCFGDEALPIFDRISDAQAFVTNDSTGNAELDEHLRNCAAADMRLHGVVPADDYDGYHDFLEPKPDVEPPPLPAGFQTSPRSYRSPFDEGGF
jgi:hypothetical protein